MQKLHGNIQLTSYDDIFGGSAAPALQEQEETGGEQVKDIPLSELHPFKDHPFKILDVYPKDDARWLLCEIKDR